MLCFLINVFPYGLRHFLYTAARICMVVRQWRRRRRGSFRFAEWFLGTPNVWSRRACWCALTPYWIACWLRTLAPLIGLHLARIRTGQPCSCCGDDCICFNLKALSCMSVYIYLQFGLWRTVINVYSARHQLTQHQVK